MAEDFDLFSFGIAGLAFGSGFFFGDYETFFFPDFLGVSFWETAAFLDFLSGVTLVWDLVGIFKMR